MSGAIIACQSCGLAQRLEPLRPGMVAECARCGSIFATQRWHSLRRTAAFSLAALVLYVPANTYPILRMSFQGVFTENTVWGGCVQLFQDGEWLVAGIVFLASMLIPILKLLGLLFLVTSTRFTPRSARRARTRIHKLIELIGPWAMLDVFLLAIAVALVKFGRIATITPGPGLLAFASVVVLTMLASASFDSRQVWQDQG